MLRVIRFGKAAVLVTLLLGLVLNPQAAVAQQTFTLVGLADCGASNGQRCRFTGANAVLTLVSTDSGVQQRYNIGIDWVVDSLPDIDQDDLLSVEVQAQPNGRLLATVVLNISGASGLHNPGRSTGSVEVREQAHADDDDDDDKPVVDEVAGEAATLESQFEWLGPDRFAGRIRSILVHPTNDNIIYAGAATGGVWKTTDGGKTWASLDDFMPTQVIGSLAMDPQDPSTIYAGTGEIFTFFAEGLWLRGQDRGQGIFVSRDAGTSWRPLASTQTQTDDWRFVSRIAVDPSDSGHIFAATSTGLWQSSNNGQTFARVLDGIYLDVKIHPLQPRNVVASSMGGPTMFSNNFGTNWTASTFPTGTLTDETRVELAPVTQQARRWRSLVIRRTPLAGEPPQGVVGLFDSTNDGQTFTRLGIPSGNCGQTNKVYTGGLWVDPQNEQRMLIAGTHLCRTVNNGAAFTQILAPAGVPFVDFHAVVAGADPSAGVLVGHDQGLRRVVNYTSAQPTVQDLNNSLRTTQFHSGIADPTTSNVIGGTQDIGTLQREDGIWTRVIGGDGIMVSRSGNFFYGGRTQGRVARVAVTNPDDVCISATGSSPLAEAQADTDLCGTSPVSRFCTDKTPLLIDPNERNRLYVGCRRLWRTDSARAADLTSINWTSVSLADGNFVIAAMDIPQGNANLIWLGTMLVGSASDIDPRPDGRLRKSINATSPTPTFTRMDDGKGLPSRPVTDVAIDPRDNNKVYVSYSGFASDNLWKTTNGGTTFTNIGAGLPDVPIWAVAVHPTMAGWLYAGTDIGLYTSTDDGVTWSATTRGPATVPISDLQWKGSTTFLTVATYGRGVHEFDARPNPELLFPETVQTPLPSIARGRVENLLASDDKRLVLSSPTLAQDLVATLTTRGGFSSDATPSASALELSIESVASQDVDQKLELFDFLSGQFITVQIVRLTAGQERVTTRFIANGASRFISSTTRHLQARLTWATGARGGPYSVEIDAVRWKITRP